MMKQKLEKIHTDARNQLDANSIKNNQAIKSNESPTARASRSKAHSELQGSILSDQFNNAVLLLSSERKERLVLLAAHFFSMYFEQKQGGKKKDEISDRWHQLLENKIQRNEITVTLLRQQVLKTTEARRKGADVIHAENRAMKADVFSWLDSYSPKFTIIEAAARAIVKQQPITHSTARDWFKEWRKVRSTDAP